eukprot:11771825-Ditylum_brightwellii.AAC.1
MIRMNLIKNNKVSTEDVNLAKKAFGPDIGAIKGKITRSKSMPVMNNKIEIQKEMMTVQQNVTISMDGLSMNGLKFLTTVMHDIFYRTAQYVTDPIAPICAKCVDEVRGIYKKGGFSITEIHCDDKFHKAMNSYAINQEPHIHMNYALGNIGISKAEAKYYVALQQLCDEEKDNMNKIGCVGAGI